ncbi:MAG TPA: OmpH family outer membrane protein [Alphaproteobacteria bacterium]
MALACVAVPLSAHGQQKPKGAPMKAPVIAVLDMRVIMRDSAAGKSIQTHVDAKRKVYRERIAGEEKEIRSAWEALSRQRSILSPEAYQQRERQFREREATVKRKIAEVEQELNRELRGTLVEAKKIVDQHLQPVLEGLIQERGIDLILPKQELIYTSNTHDITSETLKRLDGRLPRIDMKSLGK